MKATILCRNEDAKPFLDAGYRIASQRTDNLVELARTGENLLDVASSTLDALLALVARASTQRPIGSTKSAVAQPPIRSDR